MKVSYTDNEHIIDYLDYYLKLFKPPGYAILLRGEWGSGKTWFINQYRSKKEKEGFGFLYVSLYGIKEYSEIEDAFFKQLHPVLSSKGMKLAGQILKGLIKTSVNIDLNGNKIEDFKLQSQIPDFEVPEYFKKTDSRIIIFDDLERCTIEISNILGYINQYVENFGLKVIVLANEEEIFKNQNSEEDEIKRYKVIKEKLIGKTFEVRSNFTSAFNSFTTEIKGHNLIELLKESKNLIEEIYNQSEYENLRLVKQTIHDFSRFYYCIPKSAFKKPGLIDEIISFFFALSFEFKKGIIDETTFLRLFSSDLILTENDALDISKDEKIKTIRKKYSIFNRYHIAAINIYSLFDFYKNGVTDKDKLIQSIENSIYYEKENTPKWVRLYHFLKLENDSEFKSLYLECLKGFKELQIVDMYILTHVTGMFLHFHLFELAQSLTKEEILEYAKKNVDNLFNKGLLKKTDTEDYFPNASLGLGYYGYDSFYFKQFIEYRDAKIKVSTVNNYSSIAKDLLELMEKSPVKFVTQMILTDSKDNLYYEIPVLKEIKPEDFVSSFMKLSNPEKRRIGVMFVDRYKIKAFHKDLIDELDWLKSVVKSFEEKLLSNSSQPLTNYIIRDGTLLNINTAISYLEKTK